MAKESMRESKKVLLEADMRLDLERGQKAEDILNAGSATSSRRLYKFQNNTPQPIHQDTAKKLRDFITGLDNIKETKKQIYMRYHGLLESSPTGGETMPEIAKDLSRTKQAISLTIIEVQTSIQSAMLAQDLTMEDFLP